MSKTVFSRESRIVGTLEGTPCFVVKKHLGKKRGVKNCKIMELRSRVTEDYIWVKHECIIRHPPDF